jgi:hypothetical protein
LDNYAKSRRLDGKLHNLIRTSKKFEQMPEVVVKYLARSNRKFLAKSKKFFKQRRNLLAKVSQVYSDKD